MADLPNAQIEVLRLIEGEGSFGLPASVFSRGMAQHLTDKGLIAVTLECWRIEGVSKIMRIARLTVDGREYLAGLEECDG